MNQDEKEIKVGSWVTNITYPWFIDRIIEIIPADDNVDFTRYRVDREEYTFLGADNAKAWEPEIGSLIYDKNVGCLGEVLEIDTNGDFGYVDIIAGDNYIVWTTISVIEPFVGKAPSWYLEKKNGTHKKTEPLTSLAINPVEIQVWDKP